MSNFVRTVNDIGGIVLGDEVFRDELLYFSGIATVKAGTILARRKVATSVTASACTGTGTGTVTAASVIAGALVPLVGVYTLRCIEAVTNGGVFRLEDPNGAIVASYLAMTPGSGGTTTFKVAGMQFTVTDATDFAVGDTFTLTVAADGKLVPFATDGVGGAQLPVSVVLDDITSTGAGSIPIRALIGGVVNKDRLVIDADGDGSNLTTDILDQLRNVGIESVTVKQLAGTDN